MLVMMCVATVQAADSSAYKEVYTVAYSETHNPFTYVNSLGNPAGMGIDMMDYIAKLAGVEVEYIPLSEVKETGQEVDINLAILTENQLEQNTISSETYFAIQMMAIGKDGTIPYEDAAIGHLDYVSISEGNLTLEGGTNMYTYSNYDDLEKDLENGTLDYIFTTSLVANKTIIYQNDENFSIEPLDYSLDMTLKFNEDISSEEIEAFNQVIEEMDLETSYNIMLNAAVSADMELTFWEKIVNHKLEIVIGLLVLVILTIYVAFTIAINKRKALLEALDKDDLTGLLSERKFIIEAERILREDRDTEYTIVSIDIDNFKYINEVYGYDAGTKAILSYAKKLEERYISSVLMARSFADNFLILMKTLPDNMELCGKFTCTNCLGDSLEEVLGNDYQLNTSIGIYKIKDRTLPISYMIDCSNIARRRGKKIYGRTKVEFTEHVEKELKMKNHIISSMEKGIQNHEFTMQYQPKIDFKTKEVVGAEALVRWMKEDGKQIYPDSFIPLFEKNGFITKLDYYVVSEVCEFLSCHADVPKVSINLSGISLLEKDLVGKLMEIIHKNNVDTSRVEFEITESAIVENYDIIKVQITKLKEQGISISMDDFGAGVSSLNRLKDLSIDVLKIDKEFLGRTVVNEKGAVILENVIRMAIQLHMKTVAEGVETKEQVELLERMNCDIAQGYYFSKPLFEHDFLTYIEYNKNR